VSQPVATRDARCSNARLATAPRAATSGADAVAAGSRREVRRGSHTSSIDLISESPMVGRFRPPPRAERGPPDPSHMHPRRSCGDG
jgi:hypothetical protein